MSQIVRGDRHIEGAALVNMGEPQLKLEQFPESLTHNQRHWRFFEKLIFLLVKRKRSKFWQRCIKR